MNGGRSRLLTTDQFATVAGTSPRKARRALTRSLEGIAWRGHKLVVRLAHSRGGAGGKVYLVTLDSLPAELQARARELWPELAAPAGVPALADAAKPRRRIKRRADAGEWRPTHSMIQLVRKGRLTRDGAMAIARQGREYAKGAWASALGKTGWRAVAKATTFHIHDLLRDAGVPGADVLTVEATRTFVGHFDLRKYRKVHTFRNDAKAFHDQMPAVRRDWSMLDRPLEVLVGDGTALDLRFLRPDGSEWKIWLILWYCAKTGRLFGHAFARPKGGGVRQEHIVTSLAVLAEQIGLAEACIVDRGGEYSWLELLDGVMRVIKTLPYAARSKIVEPMIRVLQARHLSLIAGYIGSDRLRKKTQSVGRPAKPFPGTLWELFAEIGRAFDAFNATPQRRLGNRSPNQCWQAHVDAGWRPTRVDMDTMMEAIARTETRKVRQGAITIKGVTYTSAGLQNYAIEEETVVVRVPLVSGFPPAVFGPDGRFIDLVHAVEAVHPLDSAGARQAGRMRTLRTRSARELERQAPPIDVGEYQAKFLEQNPPPDDAAVEGDHLDFDGELARAVAERRRLTNATEKRRRRNTGGPVLSLPAPSDGDDDGYDLLDKMLGLK
jgi:hypothetical protein